MRMQSNFNHPVQWPTAIPWRTFVEILLLHETLCCPDIGRYKLTMFLQTVRKYWGPERRMQNTKFNLPRRPNCVCF